MTTRPVIFISAVSKELKTARDHVAKTLISLGYEPKWQDIAPTETGNLSGVLRKWVDDSQAVVQLIGKCYGYEAPQPDPQFGRCSYTQYEALYARSRGKKVWYLPVGPDYTCDTCTDEPEELRQLQADYLQRIRAQGDLRHGFASPTELENLVLKLRDDLARLRRWSYQGAIAILVLLLLVAGGIVWLQIGQQQTHQTQKQSLQNDDQIKEDIADVKRIIADFNQAADYLIKGGSKEKLAQEYDSVLRFTAKRWSIPATRLHNLIEANTASILSDPNISLLVKIGALRDAGQFIEARNLAVQGAKNLETVQVGQTHEQVQLWIESSISEIQLGNYEQAYIYAKKADSLANREDHFETWASARHTLGRTLILLSRYKEALEIYNEILPLRQKELGDENEDTLMTRNNRAYVYEKMGNHKQALEEHTKVFEIRKRTLGEYHKDTIQSRSNLITVLYRLNRSKEAEQLARGTIELLEDKYGEDSLEVSSERLNLGNTLFSQEKYIEAAKEYQRSAEIKSRLLGAEHHGTLMSRMGHANALNELKQSKAAEVEHRIVLACLKRTLGPDHADVLLANHNLALTLENQERYHEALTFMKGAYEGRLKIFGSAHWLTEYSLDGCKRLEREIKEAKAN
ncbi:tetratricopeptide repeat protein [Prosthecobacter debontii]|nr:tetratricopeptide repeat protein [Prosthecobacter debontii]